VTTDTQADKRRLDEPRSLGPAFISGDLSDLWIYMMRPPVGAIVAALVYRYLRPATERRQA
jgi:glycerol uptake facilitator-like aquaporin